MAAAYHHGTETIRIDGGSNPVYTVDGAITAIVGTAPVGAVNELTVCQTKKDFAQFGGELTGKGFTLPDAANIWTPYASGVAYVINVCDPARHKTLLGADWLATVLRFKSGVGFLAKGFGLLKTVFSVFSSGIMSVLRFLPMLASGFLKLGMALMANPIFLALGLLAVAAYLLYNNWSEVVGGAKALWQSLVTFFSGLWAKITAFFSSGIGNIAETILNFSPLGLFYQAFAGVMSWFGVTLPSTFSGFGRMLIQGLINGIKSAATAVYDTIASIGNSIKAKFQAVMDIHSPSREFRRFGGFITQGLDIGIRRTASQPIGTIGTWAGRLKDSFTNRVGQLRADVAARVSGHRADFEQARQAASAPGGVTIHFNPTINAPGGNPAQIQTALQMGLREFETLFQRMMADRERRAF